VKTQLGEVDIRIPRDRNGQYEPKIIAKKTWGQGCCFRKEEHSYNKKNRVWKPSPCPFVSQERTVSSSQMTSFLNKHMTEKSTRFY